MAMRRHVLLLVMLVSAMMLLASGVALSKNIGGDENGNILTGTKRADTIHGRGGNDTVYGKRGNDLIYGENGEDTLYGNRGDDRIYSAGAHMDKIDCGRGRRDRAVVDSSDLPTVNCERVRVEDPVPVEDPVAQ
jgi:Ca2+-binding RTX toxin-like protein